MLKTRAFIFVKNYQLEDLMEESITYFINCLGIKRNVQSLSGKTNKQIKEL